jgi:hypothetical protein
MKNQTLIFSILLFSSFLGCNDIPTEHIETNNSIIGTWEYAEEYGFTDAHDPENVYFPMYIFDSDTSFEEVARFVQLPIKRLLGFKYVKSGTYSIVSDTLQIKIQKVIYVNYADSLQLKPTPLTIGVTHQKYKFSIKSDTLRLANLYASSLFYLRFTRK